MNGRARQDRNDLRVKIRNEHDHYERWPEVRVHPDLDTAARSYLADPACEFTTMSHMIRGLVMEGLTRKKVANPETKSIITILKAWDESNRKMEIRRQFKQRIEETAREAYELVGEGKTNEAAKHIHDILMTIRDLPKEDPWRPECEELLKQKFGYLLRMTQSAPFVVEKQEMEAEWERYMIQ